jgi:hypothetical protein
MQGSVPSALVAQSRTSRNVRGACLAATENAVGAAVDFLFTDRGVNGINLSSTAAGR